MIKKTIAVIVLFLATYGIFLIYNTPSSWVISRVDTQLAPLQARVTAPRGSAWSGHGQLEIGAINLGRIDWHTQVWPLLTGHLQARLSLQGNNIEAHGKLNASRSRLRVDGLKGRADLALLARIAGLPDTAEGTLTADLKTVGFSGRGLLQEAEGEIDVHKVRLPALDVDIGTLFLHLTGSKNSNTIHGVLNNSGGDLDINGQITLNDGTRYTLIAYLKPHAGQKNDPMRDALSAMIGAPDAQGRYRYVTSGRLNP